MSEGAHQAFRVSQIIAEGNSSTTLVFDGEFPAQPGQFVMVWLPGIEERPFSVMNDGPLSLTVADVGPFTHALCALSVGERAWIRGPYGQGFELVGRRPLLVAGGSGAASLTLLAKVARGCAYDTTIALGARTAEQMMLSWRFEELGCRVMAATDDGSAGYHGTVIELLRRRLEGGQVDAVYGCGPEPMLLALARYAKALHLPCQVSMERVMKCGLGICGACHCGDQLVCRDGPVFAGDKLLELKALVPHS